MAIPPNLQPFGLLLVVVGTLGGCVAAIVDPARVAWGPYAAALAVGGVGVALVQLGARRAATDAVALEGKLVDVRESAAELAEELRALADRFQKDDSVYDLPAEIDDRFPPAIQRFVQAREAIARVHGVQTYADVMGDFAAGERYLNRVWSAAAEGYVDEAATYLDRAARQFERTRDALVALARAGG